MPVTATTFAPYTAVPRILVRSRSAGTRMKVSSPADAERAATLLARLPVLAQPTIRIPNSRAFDSATDTTRSLNERVGKLTASFLIHSRSTPSASARRSARISGVPPTCGPTVGSPSSGSSSR